MNPFVDLILRLISLYSTVVIVSVVVSLMKSFGMLDTRNHIVMRISHFLDTLTEPLLSRIRKVVKPVAGLDFSPLILLIGIQFLNSLVGGWL